MGAMKNFFHEEICRMQEGEELNIDDEYMYAKWLAAQHDEMKEAIAESDVPSFFQTC
jgi:hypothetical protein